MKNNFSKGFTLLELLVVIAVIGILTAIVIASLTSSRNKSADAAIKSNLNSVRSQAELIAPSLNNSYGTRTSSNCPAIGNTAVSPTYGIFSNLTIKTAIEKSAVQSGGAIVGSGTSMVVQRSACVANGASWAAAVTLKENTARAWCVDSSGKSKQVTIASANSPTTAYSLVSGVYTCN